jgi:hypothetical protein
MEIYIIMCISFAILYHIRYVTDIIFITEEVAKIHDAESHFPKYYFIIINLIVSILLMPIVAFSVITNNRDEYIKSGASKILIKYYDLELKK